MSFLFRVPERFDLSVLKISQASELGSAKGRRGVWVRCLSVKRFESSSLRVVSSIAVKFKWILGIMITLSALIPSIFSSYFINGLYCYFTKLSRILISYAALTCFSLDVRCFFSLYGTLYYSIFYSCNDLPLVRSPKRFERGILKFYVVLPYTDQIWSFARLKGL